MKSEGKRERPDSMAAGARETEGWDELPAGAKVVGRRQAARGGLVAGDALQRLANDLGQGRVTWPKGVWRFRTHEEAEASRESDPLRR